MGLRAQGETVVVNDGFEGPHRVTGAVVVSGGPEGPHRGRM